MGRSEGTVSVMRRVKNAKVIRRVADKTRKAGRGRNIIAVLAITLTTVLFTSVFTVGGSLIEKSQQETMRQVGGSAHAGFKYLTQEEYDIVKKDPKLKEVSYRIIVGDAVNDSLKKLRTEVNYYEDLEAKLSFCYPDKGHMPEKEDELVTSDLVLKALGVPVKLGEKVPVVLDVGGQRYEKVFTLSGYFKGDMINRSQVMAVSKEFARTVAPTPVNSMMGKEVSVADYAGRIMADFNFHNSLNLEKKVEDLARRCGFPTDVYEGINWAYMGSAADMQTVIPVIILLLVIFISGYLIIYNIFYINVYHDIQHYGLLKTIGTTGRQLRRIVRRQAYILSLYGIPAGLILGAVIGKFILPLVMKNLIFGDSVNTDVSLNVWVFAGAAVFAFLTVYISCIRPCRIASSVSPVEAVRYTEGAAVKGKKKNKKTKRVSPQAMAFANLKRNKKKVFIVVASLSLALVLLNSIYGLIRGFDMDKFVSSMAVSDYSVADATLDNASLSSSQRVLDGVTGQFLTELGRQKGVKETGNIYIKQMYSLNMTEEDSSRIMERLLKYQEVKKNIGMETSAANDQDFTDAVLAGKQIDGKIYGIGKMVMEKLENAEGELDWEKFQTGKYVITSRYPFIEDGDSPAYYDVGDKVTITQDDGTSREYEVMAVADMPYSCGIQSYGMFDCNYILPEDEFLDFLGEQQPMRTLINVEKKYDGKMEEWLSDYTGKVEDDLTYTSKAKIVEQFDSMKNMYVTIGGLLALILAMIGLLNFMNTIVTSILTRKQEFAMMEAVGMTGRQQKQMLSAEGLYYAVFTIVTALVFGSIISVTAIRMMGGEMFFFSWHFTVTPIILCIPVLILLVIIVPVVCYRRMCRDSVVARMVRSE